MKSTCPVCGADEWLHVPALVVEDDVVYVPGRSQYSTTITFPTKKYVGTCSDACKAALEAQNALERA